MKKMVCICLSLLMTTSLYAMTSTPFRIMKDKLLVVADVTNFAYNCIELDDGSIIYEVLHKSHATLASMFVTVYCQQEKTVITLPLKKQDNVISTPVAEYPLKFSASAPLSCHEYSKLIVSRDTNYSSGYILRLV